MMESVPNAAPRTLLITETAPGPSGVGGIILADLCPLFAPGGLSVFLPVVEGGEPAIPDALRASIPMRVGHYRGVRRDRTLGQLGKPGRALDAVWRGRRWAADAERLVTEAVGLAREQDAQIVWAVLDAPMSISIAKPVADALGVPLVTTVWDDIEHNVRYFRLDPLAARHARARFAQALHASRCCAVIGETMLQDYGREYGVRGIVVRHGLPADQRLPVKLAPSAADILRIGFAGSVTAGTAFSALLAALDSVGWRLNGKSVVLRLMGPRFDLRARVPRHLECFGWRSVTDTVRLLSECDINYLPQPFEPDWEAFTRLSFPSKLTTYLGAGVPLLLHTPPYGSLHGFFDAYPFGVRCDTLDPAPLIDAMSGLLADPGRYRHAGETLTRALDEAFTAERFHADFLRVLACAGSESD